MFPSATPLGTARVVAVLALLVTLMGVLAVPAFAAEEGGASAEEGPAPGINEIGTQNDVSNQYRPEPTELPPFQPWLYVPLAIVGLLMVGGLLFMYLMWQPRFAEERRSKRRR
jgi:hypothetical protein